MQPKYDAELAELIERYERRCTEHADCVADHELGAACLALRLGLPWSSCQCVLCVGPVMTTIDAVVQTTWSSTHTLTGYDGPKRLNVGLYDCSFSRLLEPIPEGHELSIHVRVVQGEDGKYFPGAARVIGEGLDFQVATYDASGKPVDVRRLDLFLHVLPVEMVRDLRSAAAGVNLNAVYGKLGRLDYSRTDAEVTASIFRLQVERNRMLQDLVRFESEREKRKSQR